MEKTHEQKEHITTAMFYYNYPIPVQVEKLFVKITHK